jgi:hypothetical protein
MLGKHPTPPPVAIFVNAFITPQPAPWLQFGWHIAHVRELIHWMERGDDEPLRALTSAELHKTGSHKSLMERLSPLRLLYPLI